MHGIWLRHLLYPVVQLLKRHRPNNPILLYRVGDWTLSFTMRIFASYQISISVLCICKADLFGALASQPLCVAATTVVTKQPTCSILGTSKKAVSHHALSCTCACSWSVWQRKLHHAMIAQQMCLQLVCLAAQAAPCNDCTTNESTGRLLVWTKNTPVMCSACVHCAGGAACQPPCML